MDASPSTTRPPTTQHISAESLKDRCSDQVSPAEPDIMLVTRSREDHLKTFDRARRSTETIDQVVDIDSDDFDMSEKSGEGPPTTQHISAEPLKDGGSDQVTPAEPHIMLVTRSR